MSTAGTALPLPLQPAPLPPQSGLYRFSVEQYERMGAVGILTEEDKVELVDGFLVSKLTKNEPHSFACTVAREALSRIILAGWYLRVEQPVRIPEYDEPEPDLAVVRGSPRDHLRLGRCPEPGEVALVIEVSDASLARDRSEKLRAYARGGIPTYWIVNLVDRQVEVFAQPEGLKYSLARVLRAGQTLALIVDGTQVGEIAVAELLP